MCSLEARVRYFSNTNVLAYTMGLGKSFGLRSNSDARAESLGSLYCLSASISFC